MTNMTVPHNVTAPVQPIFNQQRTGTLGPYSVKTVPVPPRTGAPSVSVGYYSRRPNNKLAQRKAIETVKKTGNFPAIDPDDIAKPQTSQGAQLQPAILDPYGWGNWLYDKAAEFGVIQPSYKTTQQLVDYAREKFVCNDVQLRDCIGDPLEDLKGALILIGQDHGDTKGLGEIKKFLNEFMRPNDVFLTESDPGFLAAADPRDLNKACLGVPRQQCIGIDLEGTGDHYRQYLEGLRNAAYARLETFDPNAARTLWERSYTTQTERVDALNQAMEKVRPHIPANQRDKLRQLDAKYNKALLDLDTEVSKQMTVRDANFVNRIREIWSTSNVRTVYCSLGALHIGTFYREFVGKVFLLLPHSTRMPNQVGLSSRGT